MLTRRAVLVSGAVAGAAPLFPSFSHSLLFAQTSVRAKQDLAAAPVVFSPALAHYVASSGSVLTQRIAREGLSTRSLKAASSLVHMAANHTHANSIDTVVRALLKNQPNLAQGKTIHTAMSHGFQSYRKYDTQAATPDLSAILNLKPQESAAALEYVSRVGITGVLRDVANMLGTAAHARRSLGLKQSSLDPHDGAIISDAVWHPGQPLHLQRVCSTHRAKEILCSRAATGADAGVGLALAALALACAPFTLTLLNAEFPGISIPVDAACAVFALDPVQAVAIVGGFIVAVIGAVQWVVC